MRPRGDRVPIHSDTHYRRVAAEALEAASIGEPPVPLEELAEHLAIPVRREHLPAFFSGALVSEDGMPVVLLNSALDEDVQRRTLAHLLAHVMIVIADPEESYPRNVVPAHRQADVAADELLLPEALVRDQAQKWFNDHRSLARLFGVSEPEMTHRMRDLGIIKQRGIAWDY